MNMMTRGNEDRFCVSTLLSRSGKNYALKNLEAVKDGGLARVMSVTRIQRARAARVARNLRITNEEPPLRGVFSLCYFLFGQAKRKLIQKN